MTQYFANRKPRKCPACGSKKVARILYGMPAFHMIREELDSGKIVLGGCCISDSDPSWQCVDCSTQIYKESLRGKLLMGLDTFDDARD